MKKLLALLLVLILCVSLCACKQSAGVIAGADNETACSQQQLRTLIERNIDCYYLFYVAPLAAEGDADKDGYSKASNTFFSDYDAMYEFISVTYTKDKTEELLNYPKKKTPLYKNIDGDIYVNADVITPVTYEVAWDEYDIEFTENSDTSCEFTLMPSTFTGDNYVTTGSAEFEDGQWKLTDVIY